MKISSETEILFVSHKYPPATGGMEKQSYELINGTALYLKVHTLVYDHKEPIIRFFLNLNQRILKALKLHPKIGVIHFNDGLIASLSTFHNGYKHVKQTVTIHGLDIVYPLVYFQKRIIPKFNRFNRVFAVSDATAQACIERGIKKEKLEVIPNGVDGLSPSEQSLPMETLYAKYPQLQKGKKHFITLGRPVRRKGFSWLLTQVIPYIEGDFQLIMLGPYSPKKTRKDRLLTMLPNRLRSLTMLFLGYPSDQGRLQNVLPSLNPKAIHLGKVPFEDLEALLKHSLAFLMPNIPEPGDMEGFGLVCLEASSTGSLVIASSLEGITTAVQHHKNGILLPTQDTEAWIAQLQDVLNNPESYRESANQYTQYTLTTYSWDKMARAYGTAFMEICNSVK